MEMITDFGQIKPLFERAKQVAIAKYGSEPSIVVLREDGDFEATWFSRYSGGDDDKEYISFSEVLDANLDELVAERLAKQEIQRKISEDKQRERERLAKEQKERDERHTYEVLKRKFESKLVD